MKKFLSSLLFIFATMVAIPVHADDPCRNLFDKNTMWVKNAYVSASTKSAGRPLGTEHETTDWSCTGYIKVSPNTTYTMTRPAPTAATVAGLAFYTDKNPDTAISGISSTGNRTDTFTTPANCNYVRFSWNSVTNGDVQLERGTTATAYQPYNPLCATCQGIVKTYESAVGTVAQNGTPTPTNPVEPTFYQQGDMILRKVGNYADSYDATTGKITRRVGMRILDGTENWEITTASVAENSYFYLSFHISLPEGFSSGAISTISTHFPSVSIGIANNNQGILVGRRAATGYQGVYVRWNDLYVASSTTLNSFKQWLAEQYANGTPVIIYYPLATETTANWNETTYCAPNIKIATTAYNAARFSPVVTDLNSAVATIREIVTKTINQTAAIASLQADKQTRPEDACPAGKKCLLVETEENGVIVPHWFPIIEAPE